MKLIFVCSRRPELSREAYAAHLLRRHAPLALRHHVGLRGYELNLVEESASGDGARVDSLNALHYATLEEFAAGAYDSPEGERLVTEDHARFLGGAAGYATEERVFLAAARPTAAGGRSPGVKWIAALRRAPRLSAEDFARALEVDLVPEALASQPHASQLAIDRVVRVLFPDDAPRWDAFYEVRFADAARAPAQPFDSPDCALALHRLVARLCAESALWRVAEHVLRRADSG